MARWLQHHAASLVAGCRVEAGAGDLRGGGLGDGAGWEGNGGGQGSAHAGAPGAPPSDSIQIEIGPIDALADELLFLILDCVAATAPRAATTLCDLGCLLASGRAGGSAAEGGRWWGRREPGGREAGGGGWAGGQWRGRRRDAGGGQVGGRLAATVAGGRTTGCRAGGREGNK
ncbi:cold shock protein 2-like [Setaria italica]|uniref:cold shock protein 2-like n=1 Tax=Setaria italica TaxID=4555 RepID=UPI000351304B|nr:cold shock protein 2-like [Setaria italica]